MYNNIIKLYTCIYSYIRSYACTRCTCVYMKISYYAVSIFKLASYYKELCIDIYEVSYIYINQLA